MYTYKVMLKPNNKQETRIRQTANKCVECHNLVLDYLMGFIERNEKIPSVFEVRRWFTKLKNLKDEDVKVKREGLRKLEIRKLHLNVLFYDVSNDALKQTVKDTYNSFVNWFKKLSKKPVRKSFTDYKKSFYVDPYKINFDDRHVKLEKIATSTKSNRKILNLVRLSEKGRIPKNVKYYNPRVVIEGERIFIVVAVDDANAPLKYQEKMKSGIIGIDVNVHSIDLSDGKSFRSPLKKSKTKRIIKKGKRLQRKGSKKLLMTQKSVNGRPIKSNSYKLLNRRIQRFRRKLVNVYTDYHFKVIKEILSNPPEEIHIEDLTINYMKKNSKLSHSIHLSSWGKFYKRLIEKCTIFGIKVLKIDKFFPSSKTCHNCGYVNKDLKLSDREFICPKCGYKIRRDLNAALNIRDFKFN